MTGGQGKWMLQVTAGPGYEKENHEVVPVNQPELFHIETEHIAVDLNVRVQNYHGLPLTSPPSSPYFDAPPHDKNKDQYSIAFKFVLKSPINSNDLVFGNDFDNPIRDRLPPGFNTAFKIVKWAIDPGLDGDVYADRPYLYGPLASSLNTFRVGRKKIDAKKGEDEEEEEEANLGKSGEGLLVVEGGEGDGEKIREEKGVPEEAAARKKFFLVEEHRRGFEFEAGREYYGDFYNPYLDFNEFSLHLPGFTLPIMKYWDGQGLRYVLKNRATDQVLFTVLFTLYLREDIDEETGRIKMGAVPGLPYGPPIGDGGVAGRNGGSGGSGSGENGDEEEEEGKEGVKVESQQAHSGSNGVGGVVVETSADDVD